jgi:hypothetical protein
MDSPSTQPPSNEPSSDLPAVQGPPDSGAKPLPPDFDGHVPAGQTMPVDSSLVPAPETVEGDLIEKEWVEKAKQIVGQTSDDPFMQQQELSKMKAQYMKKRYNKDIGVK